MAKLYPYINAFTGDVKVLPKNEGNKLNEDWHRGKLAKNEKGEKVLADYIHPPNKVTKHKAHSQNPHYNLYFPDGTKSAIIIDMD